MEEMLKGNLRRAWEKSRGGVVGLINAVQVLPAQNVFILGARIFAYFFWDSACSVKPISTLSLRALVSPEPNIFTTKANHSSFSPTTFPDLHQP